MWKVHRKLIQPTFNIKVLQSFFEIFRKHSEILIEEVMTKYRGNEFDVLEIMSDCTLNIICGNYYKILLYIRSQFNLIIWGIFSQECLP